PYWKGDLLMLNWSLHAIEVPDPFVSKSAALIFGSAVPNTLGSVFPFMSISFVCLRYMSPHTTRRLESRFKSKPRLAVFTFSHVRLCDTRPGAYTPMGRSPLSNNAIFEALIVAIY